jgi:hypothetical protein
MAIPRVQNSFPEHFYHSYLASDLFLHTLNISLPAGAGADDSSESTVQLASGSSLCTNRFIHS